MHCTDFKGVCQSAQTTVISVLCVKKMEINEKLHVPATVLAEARLAVEKLVPRKSKSIYEREYQLFSEWRQKNDATGVNETIILAYMLERSKKAKSSSLWSYYSQLKKMLLINENIDIRRPKKSKVFTREDLEKFLDSASDEDYLLLKVVLIMGVAGGTRIGELVNMSVDDVEDRGNVLVVQIPDSKTYKKRVFTVVDGSNSVHAIDVYRKYIKLRPATISHKRLFLNYKKQKCTVQPVVIKTFSKIPQMIAKFLGLSNPEEYTGHSFRRSFATLLADSGADLSVLKRHGGWRSNTVAEGYVEDSIANKINISHKILGETSGRKDTNSRVELLYSTSSETTESTAVNLEEKENLEGNYSGKNIVLPVGGGVQLQFNNLKDCNFYVTYKE